MPVFEYKTHTRIRDIPIGGDKLFTLIPKINSEKAHGPDTWHMLKLCDDSIVLHIKIILQAY